MRFTSAPKPDDERQRTNSAIYKNIPLKWDGLRRGLPLPEDFNWGKRTLQWWDMWRDSVQAMVMLPSDWEAMYEAALLHDFIWKAKESGDMRGVVSALRELRTKVAQYGATHFDRLVLRMEIEAPFMVTEHKTDIYSADDPPEVDYEAMLKEQKS